MELYFLRHGPAGARAAWDGEDADRPLTDKGRELTQQVARRLAATGLTVDAVVTSPYVRALQTAEIVAEALGVATPLEQEELLRPGFDLEGLGKVLRRHGDVQRLMLVGHESDFSSAIGQLVGAADLVLRKSGIAMVELPDPTVLRGTLRWLVPPTLLA
jgi:phosphohistidine phosphatase